MSKNRIVDAVGEVNDKYLSEALSYKPAKKSMYASIVGFVAMAACLVLVICAGLFANENRQNSVVSIDINPSIEITVNRKDVVVKAVPLNADAEVVLKDLELENVELNTALNAIVGSLLKNGYMDEVYNAVNVCVENKDVERADELSTTVSTELLSILAANDLIGGVSAQSFETNKDTQKLADSYKVSVGKLGLAQEVADSTGIALDKAVELSITELWDLKDAENADFISKDEALKIALEDAGVAEDEVTELSIKIHETKGDYHYHIDFIVAERKKYTYKVDAVTGIILEYNFKLIPEAPENPPVPEDQITKTEALEIACKDAGFETSEITLEELHHRPAEKEYHIVFTVGKIEYIYVIDAVEGDIVSKEIIDHTDDEVPDEDSIPEKKVTLEEALNLALGKAGVTFGDLTMCDIKYHVHKDRIEYKVHFHVDKTHYEYIIDAVTGECTEKLRPTPPTPPTPPHEKEEPKKPEAPKPPHEKEEPKKPEPPKPPHEKENPSEESSEEPSEEPSETPSENKPEDVKEDKKPVPPHEKDKASEQEKPVPPHEKETSKKK